MTTAAPRTRFLILGVGRAHFGVDEVIVREGDRADCLYVVVEGEVEVVRESAGRDAPPLKVLGPGDSFGEIAQVGGPPCVAYVNTFRATRRVAAEAARVEMPDEMKARLRSFLIDRLR